MLPLPNFSMIVTGRSDVGRVRARNEDSFALAPEYGLVVVCDGMGGHSGGDIASRTVTEALGEYLSEWLDSQEEDADATIAGPGGRSVLERAVSQATLRARNAVCAAERIKRRVEGKKRLYA